MQVAPGNGWAFLSPGPDVLLAVRERAGALSADLLDLRPGAGLLAGDLSVLRIEELLLHLAAHAQSGILFLSCDRVERALLFVEGRIAWASSTKQSERANEQLCKFDVAERTTTLLVAKPGPAEALREQVLAVLAGCLTLDRGVFALFESTVRTSHLFLLPVPELLAELKWKTRR